jgi:hypothetical protein
MNELRASIRLCQTLRNQFLEDLTICKIDHSLGSPRKVSLDCPSPNTNKFRKSFPLLDVARRAALIERGFGMLFALGSGDSRRFEKFTPLSTAIQPMRKRKSAETTVADAQTS